MGHGNELATVNHHNTFSFITCALLLCATFLAGCGTPTARGFSGRWRPANTLPPQPSEIPLQTAYTFYAAPTDGTLKTMLGRWARDTRRSLAYRPAFDLTLYAPVIAVHSTDIDAAVATLNRLYAAQHIVVTASSGEILVTGTGSARDSTAQARVPITRIVAPSSLPSPHGGR